MSLGKIWFQSYGVPVGNNRFFHSPQVVECVSQVAIGVGEVRIDLQSPLIVTNCSFMLPLFTTDNPQIVVRHRMAGLQAKCLLKTGLRGSQLSLIFEGNSQVQLRIDKIRLQLQRLLKRIDGLLELAQRRVDVPQVAIEGSHLGIQGDRALDTFRRDLMPARLRRRDPQQMPGIGMPGIPLQDLPIKQLGLIETPCLMVLNSSREYLRCGSHAGDYDNHTKSQQADFMEMAFQVRQPVDLVSCVHLFSQRNGPGDPPPDASPALLVSVLREDLMQHARW